MLRVLKIITFKKRFIINILKKNISYSADNQYFER
jgi:hypothetical protein